MCLDIPMQFIQVLDIICIESQVLDIINLMVLTLTEYIIVSVLRCAIAAVSIDLNYYALQR